MPLNFGVRGLSFLSTVAQIAAYGIIAWTHAEQAGLGEEFVDGVRGALRLPLDLLEWLLGGGR